MALNATADFECVGSAPDPEAMAQLLATYEVDIVILDYQLVGMDGLSSVWLLRRDGFEGEFLMLTAHASPDLRRRAQSMGIDAVLAKDARLSEVLEALAQVRDGSTVTDAVCGAEAVQLSARQREVLTLMGDGLDPREIANELFISIHTARGHVKEVMRRMEATTQLEAVTNAVKSGYLVIARRSN